MKATKRYVKTQCNTTERLDMKTSTVLENEKINDNTYFIYAFDLYTNELNIKKIKVIWSNI